MHPWFGRDTIFSSGQVSRRRLLQATAWGAAAFSTSGAFAELLGLTPQMTEGPFYPDKLPLDTDNDLLIVNNSITPAIGEVTHLSGKVLSSSGEPLRNAFVEIWQVDGNGVYLHSADSRGAGRDQNFQGYGRFLTDSTGRYYFRTLKPVPYPGRTPHIHFAVSRNGQRVLTTQLLIKGNPQNERDGVFRQLREAAERERILADFKPIDGSATGDLAANFDLVLGVTPEDRDHEPVKGGIGPSERSQRGGQFGPGGPGGPGGPPPGGFGPDGPPPGGPGSADPGERGPGGRGPRGGRPRPRRDI